MNRELTRLLIMSCLLAAGGLNSVAQEKKPRPDGSTPQKPRRIELKIPGDGAFKVLGPKFAFGKVVKGAPYSATAITEHIQTLSDGNQIIRKNESTLYRDNEGRTRMEQTLETIGKWTAEGEAQQSIFIYDPVAGFSYSFDPRTRVADKIVYAQKMTEARNRTFRINDRTVTQVEFEAEVEKKRLARDELPATRRREAWNDLELKEKLETLRPSKMEAGHRKTESLGVQTIEGVVAEGTRSTLTIPAGEIGNTLPIEVVEETWRSSELQLVVMRKHRDPRSGETTYRLTNINRGEPDRSLFEVPSDYTIREEKVFPKFRNPKPTREEQ